jgi:hypothetical protein
VSGLRARISSFGTGESMNSMLSLRRAASEPAQMSSNVTVDGYILFALLTAATIGSMYLAGRKAEHRGRRFTAWAWIAAFIGPLALPLVLLFPNLRGRFPAGTSA